MSVEHPPLGYNTTLNFVSCITCLTFFFLNLNFLLYSNNPIVNGPIMGRRSKNKQPAPTPLEPKISSKRLGKRKAEEVVDPRSSQRPTKKIKDVNGKEKGKPVFKMKLVESDSDSDSDSEDGSGWEDMEEDEVFGGHLEDIDFDEE